MDVAKDDAHEPIDVSVLEALIDVRKQQELVDQLCKRADEMKAAVAAAVYERVVADYARRREGLERDAAPLVTRAMAEYRKLRALHAEVQQAHDAARLDRDEIEFRHSLGEIDDATRDERLKHPESALAEASAELAKLDAHDVRFREALPDVDAALAEPEPEPAIAAPPEALHEPTAEPTPEPPAESAPEPALEPRGELTESVPIFEPDPLSVAALAQEKTVWLSDPPPPIPFPQRGSGSGSADVSRLESAVVSAGVIEAAPPIPAGEVDPASVGAGGGAALISESDAGRSVNYQLTALTYIGRAEDNQIRILDPGISRRHVLITATAQGYTLRDLKSQNGTYLNGERIDETPLSDGDRITLGEVTLIFRRPPTPAPASDDPQTRD
jgi:hypothetical protein